jgi:hypothetical protein
MGIEDMGLTQNYDATLHGLSVNPRESWQWFGGHRVIDITNGHFIHAGPLEGIGVSIYSIYLAMVNLNIYLKI